MKIIRQMGLACAIGICSSVASAGDVSDTLITKLAINKSIGDMVFIAVDKTKGSLPTCHSNTGWAYVLPLTSDQDKKVYALLLAARSTQTPITLAGNGACDTFFSVESLMSAFY